MRLLERLRNWWIAPILAKIEAEKSASIAEVATTLKTEIVHQLMSDTTAKMASLNHVLATTYQTEERKLGLVYKSPQSVEQAMSMLSRLAPILDFYYRRNDDYELFNVLIHAYDMVWEDVKKCVYTSTGISLESVKFVDLGMSGLLEALHVFVEGINEENIPDQYTAYVGGLHETAIAQLYSDISGGKIKIDENNMWGDLLGRSLQYSAVRIMQELDVLQGAGQIRAEVGRSLSNAIHKMAEATRAK